MESSMNRDEHLAWAKRRALGYLPADPNEAIVSMLSDLRKHDAWPELLLGTMMMAAMADGSFSDPVKARRWIEGWN